MEKLKAGTEFIFSSYKRTAAILFVAALTLAIPITVSLLQQQQDVRQRAASGFLCDEAAVANNLCNSTQVGQVVTTEGSDTTTATFPSPSGSTCGWFGSSCPQGYVCAAPTGSFQFFTNKTCVPIGTTPTTAPTNTPSPTLSTSPAPTEAAPSATIVPTGVPTSTTAPTNTPGETRINLSLQLTGIGVATQSALGINNRPTRPARNVDLKLFNSQNQEVLSKSGGVQFDSGSGLYKGTITLGANFAGGAYIVKVRTDNTLWKQILGIQNITPGTTNNLPITQLISGDIAKQDNELNLFDYNKMIGCLRGIAEACQ